MNIIVIGAGPCGIMSAIRIKELHPEYNVTLLEKNESIGQRIRVSGNGRCNFANTNFSSDKYNHPEFIYGYENELETFKNYLSSEGFYYFSDNEGRCYPHSETSTSFLYFLQKLLNKYRVEVKTSTRVKDIKKENGIHIVLCDNSVFYADKIVIALGGVSLNNDLTMYNHILHSVNANITMLSPSLTPIVTSYFSKRLEGKRVKSNVKLMYEGNVVKEERGEVLFKKNGVSGIVIFNMSSYLARLHLSSYSKYSLSIDMLPDLTNEELENYLKKDNSLKNMLQEDIAEYIISEKINPKDFILDITGLYDLKNSQVTSGGVSLIEMNPDLTFRKDESIFIGGEALDIDGVCGGYNIEFALLSGIRIGNNI